MRLVERLLQPWDNDDTEIVLRWRLWLSRWFPYRTAEFLGVGDDGKMLLGPWKWHRPDRFRKIRETP